MYQFGQYAWTHMILMVTTVPSSFFVANVFCGIIWYVLPVILIVANDIFAYLAGGWFNTQYTHGSIPVKSLKFLKGPKHARYIAISYMFMLALPQLLLNCALQSCCYCHPSCRLFLWSHTADQAVSQKDLGGIHRGLCWHSGHCIHLGWHPGKL